MCKRACVSVVYECECVHSVSVVWVQSISVRHAQEVADVCLIEGCFPSEEFRYMNRSAIIQPLRHLHEKTCYKKKLQPKNEGTREGWWTRYSMPFLGLLLNFFTAISIFCLSSLEAKDSLL